MTYPAVVISFALYALLVKTFGEDKVTLFEAASGAEPLA
jgi:hypothetical protein